MNIEETKQAIKVMQAFVDGAEMECRESYLWVVTRDPHWHWGVDEYRTHIKPESREWWVNVDAPKPTIHSYIERHCRDSSCIKVREVIE